MPIETRNARQPAHISRNSYVHKTQAANIFQSAVIVTASLHAFNTLAALTGHGRDRTQQVLRGLQLSFVMVFFELVHDT